MTHDQLKASKVYQLKKVNFLILGGNLLLFDKLLVGSVNGHIGRQKIDCNIKRGPEKENKGLIMG